MTRRRGLLAGLLAACLLATACSGGTQRAEPAASSPGHGAHSHGAHDGPTSSPSAPTSGPTAAPAGLRSGERRVRLTMPTPYTPSAPYGTGTDDYRCFVLDPGLDTDAFVTGLDIRPGTPSEVHHVILFRLPPDAVAAAEAKDAADQGEGWTCFGATGLETPGAGLDDAPWLGAWAPGGHEQVLADDVGVPLQKGSRIVMQVHYNLLAGAKPDTSATELRIAPGTASLDPLETMLMPAPVELPCRAGHDGGRLCDRDAAVADVQRRFGDDVGQTANYLHLLCGNAPAGPVQTCDRTVPSAATVRAAAGHMHLLGRSIRIELNPGTDRARTLLDVPTWNFDDQAARPVDPVRLEKGDTVRVTCRHDQHLRDLLPSFDGPRRADRYVVWGEGSTDEMCLGILLVTRR